MALASYGCLDRRAPSRLCSRFTQPKHWMLGALDAAVLR